MKIAFYTLGCKTNQFETQALETLFQNRGDEIVPFDDFADVYIVNTCTVTALSDKKSRNAARRAKKISPAACLIVCGCYSEIKPEDARAMCGADIVVGTQNKGQIVALAEEFFTHKPMQTETQVDLPAGGMIGRTRALLKVQDGCQNYCTYCIIPYARGKCRSITLENAAAESKKLCEMGYREIVITGIEVSSYGIDFPSTPEKPTLAQLILTVCASAENSRIRLSSLEPTIITQEFLNEIAPCKNLCHHFHLSLQSGCDNTLRRMNRKYTALEYLEAAKQLRKAYPGCAITTDLIVGFAGETVADFEESIRFIEECKLAQVHVFPYSRREGTRAYDMENQIQKAEKTRRAAIAGDVAKKLRAEFLKEQIGKTSEILFEQEKDGYFCGHAPEYFDVRVKTDDNLHGKTRRVKITAAEQEFCIGDIERD